MKISFLKEFWTFLGIAMLFSINQFINAQNCTVNAGITVEICENQSVHLNGNADGLFSSNATWTQIGGPAVVINNPSDLNSPLTGYNANESYTFRISATCLDGQNIFDDVIVSIKPVTIANAGPDQESCPGTISLAANAPSASEVGYWAIMDNPGNIKILAPLTPNSSIELPDTSAGISIFRWNLENSNGCYSYDDVVITNLGGENIVSAGIDQNLSNCYTSLQTTNLAGSYGGDGYNGQEGTWTLVSGPSYPLFDDLNANKSGISNLTEGSYIFKWEVSGTCASGNDLLTIVVPPATQNVTTALADDVQFCNSVTDAFLTGSLPNHSNEQSIWTQTAGPAATIVSQNASSTSVTGLDGTSTYSFSYKILNTSTGCYSIDDQVQISFSNAAPSINAGPDLILDCDQSQASFSPIQSGGLHSNYQIIFGPVTTGIIDFDGTSTLINFPEEGNYIVNFGRVADGVGCNSAFDAVNIDVSFSPTQSNAGTDQILACNITETDLAGNDPVANYGRGKGIWSQVSGPNIAVIGDLYNRSSHVSNLIPGVYVFRWLIEGGYRCPVTQDEVSVVVSATAPSVAAGVDKTVCSDSQVELDGNVPDPGATGYWTVSPGAGITFSNSTDPHALVEGLQINSSYSFYWNVVNACGLETDEVIITTGGTIGPTTAYAGPDQCNSSGTVTTSMFGNTPIVGTGAWTILSKPALSSPIIANVNDPNTLINGMSDGTYEIQWAISNGTCQTSTDEVIVTISSGSSASVAGADQDICGNTVNLNANSPTVGTGKWVQVSGMAGFQISDPNLPNAQLTGIVPGTYEFSWIITDGICPSTSDNVTIHVSRPPTASVTGSDQTICADSKASLSANTPGQGTGSWSLVGASPSNPTIADPTDPNSEVTGLITGTYTFRWTIYSGPYCSASTDEIVLNVSAPASAGMDQSICGSSETLLSGTPGSSGTWTEVSGDGNSVISPNSPYTANISNLTSFTNYTFRYTIPALFGCPANFDDVDVSTAFIGTQPDAGPDQEICLSSGNTATLNAVAGAGMNWKFIAGPNNPGITDLSNENTDVTGLISGIYILEWGFVSGTYCVDYTDIVRIRAYDAPSAADAGSDQVNACQLDTHLEGNLPASGVGNWSLVSGPGTIDIANPALPGSSISNPSALGTYVFEWTIKNGNVCTTSSDQVSITFNGNTPSIPDAGADINLCNEVKVNLLAATPTSGTGTWSQISGPALTIGSVNDPSSEISGLSPGDYTMRWTITSGGCSSYDDVNISNNELPDNSDVSATISMLCEDFTPVLSANNPLVGTGLWSFVSGPTIPVIVDASANVTSISNINYGSYTFKWTISNGVCPPSGSDVVINIAQNPSIANAGGDQDVCGKIASLSGNDPAIGIGTWSTDRSASIQNVSQYNSSVSNLDYGINNFTWTISNGACIPSTDAIVITSYQDPSVANAGIDQAVCLFDATLSGNIPAIGNGLWSTSENGAIANPSVSNSGVSNLDLGLNTFTWTISNGICTPSSDQVIVTTYQSPSLANAGADQDICLFDATLSGNVPSVGTGLWTSTGNGVFANASLNNTSVSNLDQGINSFTWTISNGACAPVNDLVTITTYLNPSPSNAGADDVVCGQDVAVAGNNPIVGTGVWSTSGNAQFADSNSSSTTVTNLDPGINTFIWTISNGACPPGSDQVLITSNSLPDSKLMVLGDRICEGSDAKLTIQSSENLIEYQTFIGSKSIASGNGNSGDLDIAVPASELSTGNNVLDIVATNTTTLCNVNLDNQAIIQVDKNPAINQLVDGSIICQGSDGTITLHSSENSANYEAITGGKIVENATGNGSDIIFQIDKKDLSLGDNTFNFRSALSNCSLDLINQVNIHVNKNPVSNLNVSDTEVCYGKNPVFTISGSEVGINYELFSNGSSLANVTGNGSDLLIDINPTELLIGENLIIVVATDNTTSCRIPLDNAGRILYKYCDIIVYDGFSPNGDGINEKFIIEGLEKFPHHKVLIFNRWGNKVYEASPYLSNWDGTNMFGISVGGNKLPVGTYFYIIDPGNGEKAIKGYLYLNR